MALLATQQIKITGLNPTFAAAAASDTVVPDDRTFVIYLNTDAATRTVALVTPAKLDQFGQALPDVSMTIAAVTGMEVIGPITQDFADPTTGLATVTTSATANVTVAAVRI